MDGDMARMTTAEAQGRLAEPAERVRATGERLALTEGGETVAVLVSLRDVEALNALEDRADAALAAERLAEWERTGESLTWEQVRAEMKR